MATTSAAPSAASTAKGPPAQSSKTSVQAAFDGRWTISYKVLSTKTSSSPRNNGRSSRASLQVYAFMCCFFPFSFPFPLPEAFFYLMLVLCSASGHGRRGRPSLPMDGGQTSPHVPFLPFHACLSKHYYLSTCSSPSAHRALFVRSFESSKVVVSLPRRL